MGSTIFVLQMSTLEIQFYDEHVIIFVSFTTKTSTTHDRQGHIHSEIPVCQPL